MKKGNLFYVGRVDDQLVYVDKKTKQVFKASPKRAQAISTGGKAEKSAGIGALLISGLWMTDIFDKPLLPTNEISFPNQYYWIFIGYYLVLIINAFLIWKIIDYSRFDIMKEPVKANKYEFYKAINDTMFLHFKLESDNISSIFKIILWDIFYFLLMFLFMSLPFYLLKGIIKLSINQIFNMWIGTIGFGLFFCMTFQDNNIKALKYASDFKNEKLKFE